MRDYLDEDVAKAFPSAQTGTIGRSVLGRSIYYIKAGEKDRSIIITGAIHAREYATGAIVTAQARYAIERARELSFSVYFIPCVNPDGCEIARGNAPPPPFYKGDYRLYKANARGVDLNVNFDAEWGKGKGNVFSPSGWGYVGSCPFSEPETQALKRFTQDLMPICTISYHTKGREIYYDFRLDEHRRKRYGEVAERLAAHTGYAAMRGDEASTGGYKDWCQQKLGIMAFTIEAGDDSLAHPLSERDLREDCKRNEDLTFVLQECLLNTKNT